MRFKQLKDGEWEDPIHRGYRIQCCDCDLVHRIDFRIYKGRIQFRVYRMRRGKRRKP